MQPVHGTSCSPDANAKVCKWTGNASVWDCARTGSDASRDWRNGLNDFSDWAVGDHVGPAAVTLQTQTVRKASGGLLTWWTGALVLLAGLTTSLRIKQER